MESQNIQVTKLTAHRQDAEELAAEVAAAPRSSGSPSRQKAQKGRSRLETSGAVSRALHACQLGDRHRGCIVCAYCPTLP